MGQPYVGEIRMFAGNFAPNGWEFCDGRLLPIPDNEVLFTLIGTTYGGDGENTFALPDLRGRAAVHRASSGAPTTYQVGELLGVEAVTLTANQMPSHSHAPTAGGSASTTSPEAAFWAGWTSAGYDAGPPSVSMALTVDPTGGSQPHENMAPYLVVNHIISLFGIFPSPP